MNKEEISMQPSFAEAIANKMPTESTARATLLDFVQHKMLKLGTLRFQTDPPPPPDANEVIAGAIVLYEQSSDLHRQIFDDPASTANELRLSRQSLNAQLASMTVLAMALTEQR